MTRRRVVVQAPDERGLRQVTVDGAPAGSAWSRRDLRRQLRRAGLPGDTDLEDRAAVSWRGADSNSWPDHAVRRRATTALLAAGLLVSALLLADIGIVDALGGLTFSGRLTGVLLVLAGAVQAVAAASACDFWGKRTLRYSGAVVVAGVFIAVATQGLLLAVWFQEREWTPYLPVFLALSAWSLWAAWTVWRARAWKGIPYPKSFTAGVAATVLLASANFAYSAVYQPHAALVHVKVEATFGTPKPDPELPLTYLPVTLHVKNEGAVPGYIANSIYWVWGRESRFDAKKTGLDRSEWRADTEGGADTEVHVEPTAARTIDTGSVIPEGAWMAAGTDFTTERVVQIPTDAQYDLVSTYMSVIFVRGDRGKIDPKFVNPIFSWRQKSERFFDCSATSCNEYVLHHGRIRHNNNIINVTRRPRYISSARWFNKTTSGITFLISPFNSKGRLSADAEGPDRYGVDQYVSGLRSIPYASLLDVRSSSMPSRDGGPPVSRRTGVLGGGADGLIDCWGLVTLDEFEQKLRCGWVATDLPEGAEASAHGLASRRFGEPPADGPATPHAPAIHLSHSYPRQRVEEPGEVALRSDYPAPVDINSVTYSSVAQLIGLCRSPIPRRDPPLQWRIPHTPPASWRPTPRSSTTMPIPPSGATAPAAAATGPAVSWNSFAPNCTRSVPQSCDGGRLTPRRAGVPAWGGVGQHGAMSPDPPVPREVKVIDTASLLRLEERAGELSLNQRLDPGWVRANAAPDGAHYLWPALWNSTLLRPAVPQQLRCELLITLRAGTHVMSLLDLLPDDFTPLPRVTSRDEGIRVSGLLDSAPTVREWLLGEGEGSAGRL